LFLAGELSFQIVEIRDLKFGFTEVSMIFLDHSDPSLSAFKALKANMPFFRASSAPSTLLDIVLLRH